MNHETLVVRASCPLDMYLITPGGAVLVQPRGKSNLLTCQTILRDQDKINIKCFCQQDEVIRISLQSLLSK